MSQNPFVGLIRSRKVWIVIVDAIAAILGLWVAALCTPQMAVLIMGTWGAIQPVLLTVILMIAKEDVAKLEAASSDLATRAYAAPAGSKVATIECAEVPIIK